MLWLIVCCFLGCAGLLDQVPGICADGCGAVASRDGCDCGATREELVEQSRAVPSHPVMAATGAGTVSTKQYLQALVGLYPAARPSIEDSRFRHLFCYSLNQLTSLAETGCRIEFSFDRIVSICPWDGLKTLLVLRSDS